MDCHNSHASKNQSATAPFVKGFNKGVKGIKQDGSNANPVTYEYEICYRCHSSNPATGIASVRKIVQGDLRLEFDPISNPSFHPVAGVGKNTTITGLVAPFTAASMIYCTDCHASDGTGSPAGPHGSIYPQILKYNYDRTTNYVNSYAAYELCYQCHDQSTTIANHNLIDHGSAEPHGNSTSCNTCHDPHGISSTQGDATHNSFLINFNTTTVTANGSANWWNKTGTHSGNCTLTCHSHSHSGSAYSY
jgi:uncharacterized CHY-type Zn-finger protein